MPNKNYVKGRRKEYKICEDLKKAGYDIVQRTAGSHSPIDVIAISRNPRIIILIQVKPNNYPDKNISKLLKENIWLDGNFRVMFQVR